MSRLHRLEGRSTLIFLNTYLRTNQANSGLSRARYLPILEVFLLALTSCSIITTRLPVLNTEEINTGQQEFRIDDIEARPFDEMLPRLPEENQSLLLELAGTVPEPLPELAFASTVFLEPDIPHPERDSIVPLENGFVRMEIGMANPGSNYNQPNVLCLRNGDQVACAPEVDVWAVSLPPKTLAFIPIRISAQPGDKLTFLFVPENESKRLFVGSQMLWAYAAEMPVEGTAPVEAPTPPPQQEVFGGCDVNLLLPDVSAADSYRIPGEQTRGTVLQLLINICEPASEDYVYLVPYIDRRQVVDLPGPIWRSPVRLAYPSTVIPVDTGNLGQANEFQIAIVPLNDEGRLADAKYLRFTFAVRLTD
jgi:hypothetical protein